MIHEKPHDENRLSESHQDRPSVLQGDKINFSELAATLNVKTGEQAEWVGSDPYTGEYRVFHLGITATQAGGKALIFELYRQAHGFERRYFNVLSLTLAPPGVDGLYPVESFSCDCGASLNDLSRILPTLVRITASLQKKIRPQDSLITPLLSKRAKILWTQALKRRVAS